MSSYGVLRGVCGCLLAGVVQAGCVERQVGDGDTGSSAGETGTSGASGVTPTTAPDPSSPGTGPVTTEPGTSVTTVTTEPGTSTSTTGPGTTTSTTDPGDPGGPATETQGPPQFDVGGGGPVEVPAGLMKGCTKAAPAGTAIKGASPLGGFFSTRAYFGFVNFGGSMGPVRLLFLDEAADLELAFKELQANFGDISTGPGVSVMPAQQWTQDAPFWDGVDAQAVLAVLVDGQGVAVMARLTISGHAGSWDVADPNDPPRLQGLVEPGEDAFPFAGPFDAVFCDLLEQEVIPE